MFDFGSYHDELSASVKENNDEKIKSIINSFIEDSKKMCMCDIDRVIHITMTILRNNIGSDVCARVIDNFSDVANNILPAIRFFYALYPKGIDMELYRDHFYKLANAADCDEIMDHINVFVCEFGLCSIPDIIRLARANEDTRLYTAVVKNLNPSINRTCELCMIESTNDEIFGELALGYMKEAFSAMGYIPKFLMEAPEVNIEKIVQHDVEHLVESYSGEELDQHVESYYEKYIDIGGFYQFMANLMQEGSYSMDSYHWFFDKLESIGQRCEREEKYLSLCEAQYRATGKRPRYLDNTYDFDDKIHHNDDEWINPPDEVKTKKDMEKDSEFDTKTKKHDIDDEDKKATAEAKRIYNITYNNSFNRNRSSTVKGSYNNNRTHSDDITTYGGTESFDSDTSEENIMKVWNDRRGILRKIGKAIQNKQIVEEPEDLKSGYLKSILWDDENLKKVDPWVITLDTQKQRPKDDIGYRKNLAKKIAAKADDRDIDYDGQIVVGGDLTDGIYTIELSRYNEKHIVDALRKTSNAVIKEELKRIGSGSSKSGNSTLNEALNIFDDLHNFEEAVKGGEPEDTFVPDDTPEDPEKGRTIGERMRNKVEEFNAKSNKTAANLDRTIRTGRDLKDAVLRTPMLLINTVKNFISDMNNRKEQDIKEDLLKNKTLRLRIYGMARSLIKTALPWVILGPLYGTLWNLIALPIRGIKWGVQAVRGGPHRDLMIEIREEMRAELEIMDDKIQNAKDSREKHKLIRQRSRMEQEYFQISSKIHFDPVAEKRARRGDKY